MQSASFRKSTLDLPLQNLAVPYFCRFPMLQHMGKPAVPCVKKGDVVIEGQQIGSADGPDSINIHTSIPGKVIDISEKPTIWGGKAMSVTIEAQGGFPFFRGDQRTDWKSLGNDEILRRITAAGIIALRGPALPFEKKFPEKPNTAEILIINTVENNPHHTAGDELAQTHPRCLIEGALILMKVTGARKAVFTVGRKSGKTAELLKQAIAHHAAESFISLIKISGDIHAGADRQLIKTAAKKNIALGERPLSQGVILETAATVFAVQEAVTENKPLYERYITISGKGISRPGIYKIRNGTMLSHIIEECGGLTESAVTIFAGTPLSAGIDALKDLPVDKKVLTLLFLTEKEISKMKSGSCIKCGTCTDVCTAKLNPQHVAFAGKQDIDKLKACRSCGNCAIVCPESLNPGARIAEKRSAARR